MANPRGATPHSRKAAVSLRQLKVAPRLRARALVAVLQALTFFASRLPRTGLVNSICRLAGALWYVGAPSARAAVHDNLRHVLGRQPTSREVRAVFAHGVLNYWETLAISGLTRAELLQVVRLHGHEHLDAARSNGRGAILVGAHLGSLALAAQVVPAHGYPVVGLLEPVQPPELFDLLARQRGAFGMRLLPIGPAALRELVTALRRNEIVALVVDRDVTGSGPILEFFGAPTHVADGAAALSVRTGAPILPGVGIRRADGTFDAVIEAALPKPTAGDPKRDVLELTRAVIQRLEYHIRSRPLEWTVFQKRWPALDKAPASGVE